MSPLWVDWRVYKRRFDVVLVRPFLGRIRTAAVSAEHEEQRSQDRLIADIERTAALCLPCNLIAGAER
jgi:hypothetical protein